MGSITLWKRVTSQMSDQLLRITPCDHFKFLLQLESNRAIRYTHFFLLLIVEIDQDENNGLMPVLGDLISRNIRDSDFIGLNDHQQCLLLLPNAEISDALRIGEKLMNHVEKQNFTIDDKWGKLTVSIGGACFPTHATDAQELLMTADHMLQRAKSLGGNQVCLPEA